MKPLCYVAGPYSRPDPVENTHRAIAVAEAVEARGVDVFVPHLSLLWHIVSPAPYARWCERDNAVLARCDAVVRFGGESHGADAEVKFAYDMDLPVFFWDDTAARLGRREFLAWVEGL